MGPLHGSVQQCTARLANLFAPPLPAWIGPCRRSPGLAQANAISRRAIWTAQCASAAGGQRGSKGQGKGDPGGAI